MVDHFIQEFRENVLGLFISEAQEEVKMKLEDIK